MAISAAAPIVFAAGRRAFGTTARAAASSRFILPDEPSWSLASLSERLTSATNAPPFTDDEVKRLALLAHIDLEGYGGDSQARAKLLEDLSAIRAFAGAVQAFVPTPRNDEDQDRASAGELGTLWRDDVVDAGGCADAVLSNCAAVDRGFFQVPNQMRREEEK